MVIVKVIFSYSLVIDVTVNSLYAVVNMENLLFF